MSKRSAKVLVVFVIAIVAFCLANVCALMTGTYHFNFNDDNSTNVLNNTTENNTINLEIPFTSHDDSSEQSYVSQPEQESNTPSSEDNTHTEPQIPPVDDSSSDTSKV